VNCFSQANETNNDYCKQRVRITVRQTVLGVHRNLAQNQWIHIV